MTQVDQAIQAETIGRATGIIESPIAVYSPETPTPKQELFLSLSCREALFGGAAGGGSGESAT